MLGRLERVGRDKVRAFKEQPLGARHFHLGREEHDAEKEDQKDGRAEQVLDRVIWMKGDAVQRHAFGVLELFDIDPVRVIGTHFMQGQDMETDQRADQQRKGNHMQGEKAVQSHIGHHEVAPDPERQLLADERQGAKQRDDHLRAPVGHLPPGQEIAEERLAHQSQIDRHARQPQQFARLFVGAIQQRAEHMQIDYDKEGRGAGRVHIADPPAPADIAHDVFDRGKGLLRRGLIIHREPDPGHDLDHQHQERQGAEEIPEVKIPGRVILGQMLVPGLH